MFSVLKSFPFMLYLILEPDNQLPKGRTLEPQKLISAKRIRDKLFNHVGSEYECARRPPLWARYSLGSTGPQDRM